jgi:hypothetical protein
MKKKLRQARRLYAAEWKEIRKAIKALQRVHCYRAAAKLRIDLTETLELWKHARDIERLRKSGSR